MTYSDNEDPSWYNFGGDAAIIPEESGTDSRHCSLVRLFNIMESAEQVVSRSYTNTDDVDDFVSAATLEPTPLAPGGIHPALSGLYSHSMLSSLTAFNNGRHQQDYSSPACAYTIPNSTTSMQAESQFGQAEDSLSPVPSGYLTGPARFFEPTDDSFRSPPDSHELMVPSPPPHPVSPSSSAEDGSQWMATQSCPRKFQAGQWNERFKDLMRFREEHGHLLVPHSYPPNQKLAQWVKRQRYQHRLKSMNRHTTLTDEREQILLDVGFVWDSHRAAWQYHFQCLETFALQHGSCNIPATEMPTLRTWCKHQRRQYKSFCAGEEGTMTLEKVQCLEAIGFDWNPRGL